MSTSFRNETDWTGVALAMAVWAAHFMIVWAAASIFPGEPAARWIAGAFTLISFAALGALWRWRRVAGLHTVPGLGIALAAAGVAYDALPALIG
ncbi:conserved hypothetical protein [Altererythrobacter sp. B11]|uniref:hypothetical protein n=1 Tax=Altererythrobacter sp. B11 TaxID=2060312 RepID=UPI000DC73BC7|nr:hypothetical protein [Altererythrobacter sp. B11]BBC72787.1 conserved hypothetical protein [Altererythrobacter sp. B11]